MPNWTASVTTSSAAILSVPTSHFVVTNTGNFPVYLGFDDPAGTATVGNGIALLTYWSSYVHDKPTRDIIAGIASGGTSSISYFYR